MLPFLHIKVIFFPFLMPFPLHIELFAKITIPKYNKRNRALHLQWMKCTFYFRKIDKNLKSVGNKLAPPC